MNATIRIFGCLMLLIATGGIGVAAEDEPATVSVSAHGTVVDVDGKPVAGARVVLREWARIRYSEDPYSPTGKDVLAETVSGENGEFRFENLPAKLFKRFEDYTTPWDVIAIADGHALGWAHLTSAEGETPVDVQLHEPVSVKGRVVDGEGKPVEDCKVSVVDISPVGSSWNAVSSPQHRELLDLYFSAIAPHVTTSSAGEFEIENLPKGYRLGVELKQPRFVREFVYVGTTDEPQPDVEQPGRDEESRPVLQSGFTATLEPGLQVRGRVVYDDSEKPVEGAKMFIHAESRAFHQLADSEGRFEFTALLPLKWSLRATNLESRDAGYLDAMARIDPNPNERESKIELRMPRGEEVRGKVVDERTSEGVTGVYIAYVPLDDEKEAKPQAWANSNDDGSFTIFVPSGRGTIRVGGGIDGHPTHDVPNFWRWQSSQGVIPGHSQEINVVAGKRIDDVRLTVGRGLIIRGRVVGSDGKSGEGVAISVKDQYGREIGKPGQYVTDSEGKFEVTGLVPYQQAEIEFIAKDGSGRGSASVPEDKVAKSERVVDLGEVELRSTGTVRGRVLADGEPLAGASVTLNMKIADLGRGGSSTRLADRATTNAEGRYEFQAVEAGREYTIFFYSEDYTQTGSKRVEIEPGEVYQHPDIRVRSRRGFVAGIVTDPNGQPVAGVTVSASSADRGSIGGGSALSDEQGRFRINGVTEGGLELMAYIRQKEPTKDRSIHFPAHANCNSGDTDVRIVLDPKLQRPLP